MDYSFSIKGVTPLLMSADNVTGADELKKWQTDPANADRSVKGDDRSPAWTWLIRCYHDGDQFVMPSDNIMACLREAGKRITLKGNKTYKQLSQSGMVINEELCPLLVGGKPVSYAKYAEQKDVWPFDRFQQEAEKDRFSLFVKRARPPGQKSKHVRVRPRFDDWEIKGTLQTLSEDVTPEVLEKLFGIAGTIGLGDWRPGAISPGVYGQFSTELN